MPRLLVNVAFAGDSRGAIHRGRPGSPGACCGAELTAMFTGWLPADVLLELVDHGVLCGRQGCFHPQALERLEDGELGSPIEDGGEPA